ncbi:MAG: hypothetical protein PHC56_10330, partial [Herbinix sp.]|nr:hypothetical protein [Herbinix sp.]
MDSEFRKPFEFEEEKKGLVLLFVIMILAIDTLQTLSFATQESKYLENTPILGIASLIIGGMFVLYIIYTTVIVFRMKGNYVVAAKRYII